MTEPLQGCEPVLVRVAPEILERMKAGDVEPVVILGVQEQPDGTYDMTLKVPELDVRKEAIVAVAALLREWTTEHEEGEDDWRYQAEQIVIAIECGDLPS